MAALTDTSKHPCVVYDLVDLSTPVRFVTSEHAGLSLPAGYVQFVGALSLKDSGSKFDLKAGRLSVGGTGFSIADVDEAVSAWLAANDGSLSETRVVRRTGLVGEAEAGYAVTNWLLKDYAPAGDGGGYDFELANVLELLDKRPLFTDFEGKAFKLEIAYDSAPTTDTLRLDESPKGVWPEPGYAILRDENDQLMELVEYQTIGGVDDKDLQTVTRQHFGVGDSSKTWIVDDTTITNVWALRGNPLDLLLQLVTTTDGGAGLAPRGIYYEAPTDNSTYVDIADAAELDLTGHDFTIEFRCRGPFFVRGTTLNGLDGIVVGKHTGYGVSDFAYGLIAEPQGLGVDYKLRAIVSDGTGPGTLTVLSEGFEDNVDLDWRHHAIVFQYNDGSARSRLSYYIDGTLVGSSVLASGLLDIQTNANPVRIGAGLDPTVKEHTPGIEFDKIRISKTARYLADFQPPVENHVPDADTVRLYKANEGSGAVLADESSYLADASYEDPGGGGLQWADNGQGTNGQYDLGDGLGIGVPAEYVNISEIEAHRNQFWPQPTFDVGGNVTAGHALLFVDKEEIGDLKKFAEAHLLRPYGMKLHVDEQERLTVVNYFDVSTNEHDIGGKWDVGEFNPRDWPRGYGRQINVFLRQSDYDPIEGDYIRSPEQRSQFSIDSFGESKAEEIEGLGHRTGEWGFPDLNGQVDLQSGVSRIISEVSNPWAEIEIEAFYEFRDVALGDVALLNVPVVLDLASGRRGIVGGRFVITARSVVLTEAEGLVLLSVMLRRPIARVPIIGPPGAQTEYSTATDAEREYVHIAPGSGDTMSNGDPSYRIT